MHRPFGQPTRAIPAPGHASPSVRRLRTTCAALLTFGLLAASCGSDDDKDSTAAGAVTTAAATEPTDAATATTAEAGTETTAGSGTDRTGEVIKVGYVNNEGGVFSLPEFRTGGEVAIEQINANGGINGATIEIVNCMADASPEGAINCANTLVEENVVMAYTGIDVASDAAIGIYAEAGIPYVTSNGWGPAQEKDPNAFILHAASSAYFVTPLATLKDLGVTKVGIVREDTVAGESFSTAVRGYAEDLFGLEVEEIVVDPANPDWTAALATAQSADVGGVWGQLTEPGCIGLTTAAAAVSFDGVLFAGSCSIYISVVGDAAIGSYNQTDVYFPDMRSFAPPEIQTRLDEYAAAMTDAGYEDQINGFAVAAYSAWYELRPILESIEGEITAESIKAALSSGEVTPGWLGPDIQCGGKPWPTSPSACSASLAVWKVVELDDGTLARELVADFTNSYELTQK